MKKLLAIFSILLILTLGCTQQLPPANNSTACTAEAKICPDGSAVGRVGPDCEFAPCPIIVGNDTDAHGCKPSAGYSWCQTKQKCLRIWEEGCLNQNEAREIAANSSCMDVGNLTADNSYNNYTNTWWIGLDIVKPGCSPACVVYEDNKTVEINWRCTGLVMYDLQTANTSLGEILVDGYGYTLYTFTSDSINASTCSGTCASDWPPLILNSDEMSVPKAILHKIGIFAMNSTSVQITYNGMPLYHYAGDASPGDTNGQGISGKWYVVNASG